MQRFKIPKNKVKIGCHTYRITHKDVILREGEQLLGLCDADNQEIILKKNLKGSKRLEVFIHECLHGMEDSYDIKLGEKKVAVLSQALISFIDDNKIEIR